MQNAQGTSATPTVLSEEVLTGASLRSSSTLAGVISGFSAIAGKSNSRRLQQLLLAVADATDGRQGVQDLAGGGPGAGSGNAAPPAPGGNQCSGSGTGADVPALCNSDAAGSTSSAADGGGATEVAVEHHAGGCRSVMLEAIESKPIRKASGCWWGVN